jgi:hypothetical protein
MNVFTGNNDNGNKFIATVVDTGGNLIAGEVDGDKHFFQFWLSLWIKRLYGVKTRGIKNLTLGHL